MGILLIILKIIGIVLAVLAGLLLCLLLAVFFLPVRYRIRGSADGCSRLTGDALVTWLFRLVRLRLSYGTDGIQISFRIFGIPFHPDFSKGTFGVRQNADTKSAGKTEGSGAAESERGETGKSGGEEPSREETGSAESERGETGESRGEKPSREETGSAESERGETGESGGEEPSRKERGAAGEEIISPELKERLGRLLEGEISPGEPEPKPEEQSGSGQDANLPKKAGQEKKSKGSKSRSHKKRKKRKNIMQRIKKAWAGGMETVRRIRSKSRTLLKSIWNHDESGGGLLKRCRAMIQEEANKTAVLLLWKEFKYLVRHLSPRKVTGTLAFGLEDPALTGQILAVLSTLPYWQRYQISIEPDFQPSQPFLRGKIGLKGHLRAIHFIRSGIRILKDKNIRKLIKQVKQ